MSDALLDFVTLRCLTLDATPGCISGTEAARARLAGLYERARPLGLVHERVAGPDGAAVAQLMFFRDPCAWFGGPVVLGWIDRDPGDAASLAPLLGALDRNRVRLGPETLLEISVHDGPLLAGLIARGFGIDSVIQVGAPQAALARLDRAVEAKWPATCRLEPLTLERVPDVVDLHRRVFSAEPAWCWFGAYPQHLARMTTHLRAHPEGQFALVDRSTQRPTVVGHLGAELDDNPLWGRVGGLELVLDPALRGHGLARPLYRAALQSLLARGAETFKGGTSQPGVMALGRVMQRPWHSFNVRRDVPFSPEHFLRFAPDDVRRAHATSAE